MDKNNRLYGVVKKFSELDLDPKTVSSHVMGYMFEDLIRRFSTNAEAGDHYTPREVIRLMVNIILAEGCDDLLTEGKVATVQDCGTGGMLSTTYDFLHRLNPNIDVSLFGQEINPESYAICLADMLIKGQDAGNIRFQNTMIQDCFPEQRMRIVIAPPPPFGTPWGGKDAPEGGGGRCGMSTRKLPVCVQRSGCLRCFASLNKGLAKQRPRLAKCDGSTAWECSDRRSARIAII